MKHTQLADFIDEKRVAIVAEWEVFARTLGPASTGMSALALRDHADDILTAIVCDMKAEQTAAEQAQKSKGRGGLRKMEAIGKIHATLRIESGFKLGQMVAEYRALRASVLRLWEKVPGSDPGGVTRFNEAVDEALAEAIGRFTKTTESFRDQSIGILGHDLRNPLSSIVMGATVLVNSQELGDHSVSIAARMLSSAKRMGRMIDDLLDLTRTRFGAAIPVLRAPIDLDAICRQVVAEFEGLRPSGGLTFTPKGDLHGEWDSDRIAQVLSNLLRNAIQHGTPGAPIGLAAWAAGDEVVVEVHNAGPAVPPRVLATLFEPMVRHVEDDRTNSGLGLGLYIAAQVMLAHGGTLAVTSTDADGTRFTAHLPRHAPRGPASTDPAAG